MKLFLYMIYLFPFIKIMHAIMQYLENADHKQKIIKRMSK